MGVVKNKRGKLDEQEERFEKVLGESVGEAMRRRSRRGRSQGQSKNDGDRAK
jgi:hypothetical protein